MKISLENLYVDMGLKGLKVVNYQSPGNHFPYYCKTADLY